MERLTSVIRDLEVGRMHLEWAGVAWLTVGIVLATWAPELALR